MTVIRVFYHFGSQQAGAIQNQRLLKGFTAKDRGIVISSENGTDILEDDIVIKSAYFNILDKIVYRLFPSLIWILPSNHILWLSRVLKVLKKANLVDSEYIHTVSMPIVSHLIGYWMKNKYGIKWVAHFYDPYVDNSYIKNSKLSLFLRQKIERFIADNADIIIHTNTSIADEWLLRYGNSIFKKINVLPLCADNTNSSAHERIHRDNVNKINILHAGSISGGRNLDFLIDSLVYMRDNDLATFRKLHFVFCGNVEKSNIDKIEKESLADSFSFIGEVPSSELSNYFKSADVLLIIEALNGKPYFFPSKLCEYVSLGLPIVSITPDNSVVREYLEPLGQVCFNGDSVDSFVAYFQECLRLNSFPSIPIQCRNIFSPTQIAQQFLNIINKYE